MREKYMENSIYIRITDRGVDRQEMSETEEMVSAIYILCHNRNYVSNIPSDCDLRYEIIRLDGSTFIVPP